MFSRKKEAKRWLEEKKAAYFLDVRRFGNKLLSLDMDRRVQLELFHYFMLTVIAERDGRSCLEHQFLRCQKSIWLGDVEGFMKGLRKFFECLSEVTLNDKVILLSLVQEMLSRMQEGQNEFQKMVARCVDPGGGE